ncbi:MAG TPA: low temperature requirement protein A [Chloroflexota bacterium]|nr:low temperature requirement protein A [Chloroflexota bacterium]
METGPAVERRAAAQEGDGALVARPAWRPPVLRAFDQGERHASWLELFFDLCFVAAVAALADDLHHDPTVGGLLRFAGLFVPVWWAWMGYSWHATAFDADDVAYRLAFLGAMLGVVALAAGVPGVGKGDSTVFAVAYGALQLLLAGLYLRASRYQGVARGFALRYGLGDALGGALWLASVLVPAPARYGVWAAAMLVLLVTPIVAVRSMAEQGYDTGHITERYGLFTLIVLGESVVVVSAGTAATGWNPAAVLVAAAGFGIAAGVWWLYFGSVTSAALRRDRLAAAFVWGYGHLFVFAGVAAAAVGVELAIERAADGDRLGNAERLVLCAGAGAFLLAIAAIQAVTVRRWDRLVSGRAAAALAVAAVCVVGREVAPPWLMLLVLIALLAAAALEGGRAGATTAAS